MFQLNENFEVKRRIRYCDYIRFSPADISTINTPNSQMYVNVPREDSVMSLLNSYLEINFEVTIEADKSRYGNVNDIKLINLGSIAFFSNFKLTMSSGKHLEDIGHTRIVSLMHKLITSSRGSDDLCVAFDRIEKEDKTS